MPLKRIILDANFLIYCAEKKIDYVIKIDELMTEGYELVVPSQVISELENLSKKSKKFSDRTAAFLALKILQKTNIKILNAEGQTADDAIINLIRLGSIVATLDSDLKKEISKSNRIITIRGRNELAFE